MNSLTELYKTIKEFSESHNMVNEFLLLGSEEEINSIEFNYRSLIMIPLEANLSRELSSPIYTLDFGIIVIDRILENNALSSILSSEENINVIGQLQDYLIQLDKDVNFQNVELSTAISEDYNLNVAIADFSINIARESYVKDIDID